MQDRLKFRVYFKGSEYAKAGYVDLTRSDVIFSLRADGRIIRTVVYECQQEGHKGEPCNISFTQNNNLYDIQFCTGLKDKNGKLIYEGDIVKTTFKDNAKITFFVVWNNKTSLFSANIIKKEGVNGCFMANQDYLYYVLGDVEDKAEIIGNIYENQELLKEVSKED